MPVDNIDHVAQVNDYERQMRSYQEMLRLNGCTVDPLKKRDEVPPERKKDDEE